MLDNRLNLINNNMRFFSITQAHKHFNLFESTLQINRNIKTSWFVLNKNNCVVSQSNSTIPIIEELENFIKLNLQQLYNDNDNEGNHNEMEQIYINTKENKIEQDKEDKETEDRLSLNSSENVEFDFFANAFEDEDHSNTQYLFNKKQSKGKIILFDLSFLTGLIILPFDCFLLNKY